MLLYQSHIKQFIEHVNKDLLTEILVKGFRAKWGKEPAEAEVRSWKNSLPEIRNVVEIAELNDVMIVIEYEVPYNQTRVDCMLFGTDQHGNQNIVLLELKQWTRIIELEDEGNFSPEAEDEIQVYTGGADRVVVHPSQQVKGYHNYIKGFVAEFDTPNPLNLYSYVFCHNYIKVPGEGLFHHRYEKSLLKPYPVYSKNDKHDLSARLKDLLYGGSGSLVFDRFIQSPYQPSKKLLENAGRVIKNEAVFSLLDEQLKAKNLIWSKVRKSSAGKGKSVIIVHGGPGTGKSVIAVNVLAEAAERDKTVFYACKSKPLVAAMKDRLGENDSLLFSNLYNYVPNRVSENALDLLLVDEAHRIEFNSNHPYTKTEDLTDLPQVEQLIRCSKTSVFFIDDKQNVRSQEIGNSKMIRAAAAKYNIRVDEITLTNQYRCMGSNDYLLWLESALGYTKDERKFKDNDVFDFQIKDSPAEIYKCIKQHELSKPNSARMVAGFCWPWSKKLDEDGRIVKDIVIGDFRESWETHQDIKVIPKGYVKWYEWAYKTNGCKQIGCIYTVQGFDFDYVGVIIGDDLVYDPLAKKLTTDISATRDNTLTKNIGNFDMHVRNIYRTLLSRAMKGCYVYFTNKDTEKYFKSLIKEHE